MEEGYRRGTVLGLTIAEIFILLVFLMLLALMGVNRYWGEKLESWADIMKNHTPAEVELVLTGPDGLREEIKQLSSEIVFLEREKQRLQERIRTLEDREGETGGLLDDANKQLEDLKRKLAEQLSALVDAQREAAFKSNENNVLQKDNNSLRDRMRILGKGITPPCWYQRVEETNPHTRANWREKPYYLFDIAIRDDHMEVERLPIPEGAAEDDDGLPFSEEARGLALDTIPYGTRLSDGQMRDVMMHLRRAGEASQVRTYSCMFYVRVWDETSVGAKKRWKQAHDDVLEQLFGTYQVRQTSWKKRLTEPVNVVIGSHSTLPTLNWSEDLN